MKNKLLSLLLGFCGAVSPITAQTRTPADPLYTAQTKKEPDYTQWKRNSWYLYENRWYWISSKNQILKNTWKKIGTKWYWFNDYGIMHTGWLLQNNQWYYCSKNGAMATGWNLLGDGFWYYFRPDGSCVQNEWKESNGKIYYLDYYGKWIQSESTQYKWTDDYGNPHYQNSLLGFFEFLKDHNDKDAEFALVIANDTAGLTQDGEGGRKNMNQHLENSYDGYKLENVYAALDYMDECNQLRKQENLPELKVNSTMMALANKNLGWSNYGLTHSYGHNIGENVAWSYKYPFTWWYHKEKKEFEQGEDDFHVIGHYLNIIREDYAVSGFAVCSNKNYRYPSTLQTFYYGTPCSKTRNPVAISAYRKKLQLFEKQND